MHYSMSPFYEALSTGDRFVANPGYPHRTVPEILIVTKPSSPGPFTAEDRAGNVYVAQHGQSALTSVSREEKLIPSWTHPLPDLDDAKALRWVKILQRGDKAPILLHVREIEDGFAFARLVSTRPDPGFIDLNEDFADPDDDNSDPDEDSLDADASYPTRQVGHLEIMDRPVRIPVGDLPDGTAPGDLIASGWYRNDLEDGAIVTRIADMRFILTEKAGSLTRYLHKKSMLAGVPEILASSVTEEALPSVLPSREPKADSGTFGYASQIFDSVSPSDFAHEDACAVARSEPDEALVLWMETEIGSGETECIVLGTTGYTFMMCDNAADEFYGAGIEPGLWVMRRAKWWSDTDYEGNHDAGIEGDWEPATAADLDNFGMTEESVSDEIAEHLLDHGIECSREGLAAKWMEMAEEACVASHAEVPAA